MRKRTAFIPVVGLSFALGFAGTCQRPVVVESETARPDPARLREAEAAVRADLEELIRAQDAYSSENDRYAFDLQNLVFTPSAGVVIDVVDAGREGWAALGTTDTGSAECAVFVGSADPPRSYVRTAGVVACRP